MTATALKSADVAASPDSKTEQARHVMEVWCKTHSYTPGDIPEMVRNEKDLRNIGTLVYAIRTVVDLDIFPSAELLHIEPSEVAILKRNARIHIEVKKHSIDRGRLDDLLVDAGLRESKKERPRIPLIPAHPEAPKRKPGRQPITEEARARRIQEEAPFTLRRREEAQRVCTLFGKAFEAIFNNKRLLNEDMIVRHLAIAIVYALDERKNVSGISRSLNLSIDSVETAVNRIGMILRDNSEKLAEFRRKILEVCAAFGIEPVKLQRSL